jgi:hypothetical protein
MNLTPDKINEISVLAELFFTPAEIALIIEVSPEEFCQQFLHPGKITTAYNKGRLLGESKIRKSIKELAENGSAPAQQLLLKIRQDSEHRKIIEENV